MNFEEFREEMESYWRDVNAESEKLKDSYIVPKKLHSLYLSFDPVERKMADRVLAEWALSEEESLRFDALNLIWNFKITSTVEALHQLRLRLAANSTDPGAPYELTKVNRILEILGDN